MFQLYVSIISICTKRIILFHNYKFVSRVSLTSVLVSKVLLLKLLNWSDLVNIEFKDSIAQHEIF